jgi:hypothetical protein
MTSWVSMIPWIAERLESHPNTARSFELGQVERLSLLLQEIERATPQRLVSLQSPRSAVWYGGNGHYLLRENRAAALASFAVSTYIESVALRYRDPLDIRSGRRSETELLSGWDGVSQLIASAVRHSSHWKQLQTIEVAPVWSWDTHVTSKAYDIWVRPRYDMAIGWKRQYNGIGQGAYRFMRNTDVRIAHITVETSGNQEEVALIELYPDITSAMFDHKYEGDNCKFDLDDLGGCCHGIYHFGHHVYNLARPDLTIARQPFPTEEAFAPPVFLDMSDQTMLHNPPHSIDFRITW